MLLLFFVNYRKNGERITLISNVKSPDVFDGVKKNVSKPIQTFLQHNSDPFT